MLLSRLCASRAASRGASAACAAWARPAARPAARTPARWLSSPAPPPDGFNEGLPGRAYMLPFVALGFWGAGWMLADDGRIEGLTQDFEKTMKGMDEKKMQATIPEPKVMFMLGWPLAAGMMMALFESVTAKFARSPDMKFMCGPAMEADFMAPTAIALLSFAAEHPAFVTDLWRLGAVERVWNILGVYRTLPPEQHDEVLVNACMLGCKAAGTAQGKASLDAGVFAWMITKEPGGQTAQAGIEGLAHLWPTQRLAVLKSPAVTELDALRSSLSPNKLFLGELANRLLSRMAADAPAFESDAEAARAYSLSMLGDAPAAEARTLWQASGISQRETSTAAQRRQLEADLSTLDVQLGALKQLAAKLSAPTLHERVGLPLDVLSAGACGGVYGALRAFARARWKDITPSTARKLAWHVGQRSAAGVMVLVLVQELSARFKRAYYDDALRGPDALLGALGLGSAPPRAPPAEPDAPPSYSEDGLKVLVALDLANIAVLGVVNFLFPYCILPTLARPLQFVVPPIEPPFPDASG